MLVSGAFALSPRKWLINISLMLYFKSLDVFHRAEEKVVNNSSALHCPAERLKHGAWLLLTFSEGECR